jgi:alpha-amylase/alpha-mannosidase (GH57 family)
MEAIALLALAILQAGSKPANPMPVTITVTQDVIVEPYRIEREQQHMRALLQFFNDQKPVVIRRGRTFQMVYEMGQMEGGCRIRFQRREYEIASCWWREGFSDHHADIFVVKK